MKHITLEIKAKIIQDTGQRQDIDMITEGTWHQKSGAIYMTYDESEMSGMAGSRTLLKIENQQITLTRMGDHHSKMIFSKEKSFNGLYHTPYGNFEMKIITQSIDNALDYKTMTGHINIKYEMILEAMSQSVNTLHIYVRPYRES